MGQRPTRVSASAEVKESPGSVYQTFLDLIGDWWPPQGLVGEEYLLLDGRVHCEQWSGGEVILDTGEDHHVLGNVVLCAAPNRLLIKVAQPNWAAQSLIEITVVERASGATEIGVEHRGFGAIGLPSELDWYPGFLSEAMVLLRERLGS